MAQETVKEVWINTKTKTGIEVRYQAEPKRQYQVKPPGGQGEWREVPSVTTVLDCLNKSGLPWWGMKTGVAGFIELWEHGFVRPVEGTPQKLAAFGAEQWEYATVENVVALLNKQKLTVNHVRDKAGDRGHSVHTALEAWIADGTVPVPDFYPETERGYVTGLAKFLHDLGPFKTKAQSEIMVASAEHGFAGRYDMEAVLQEANLVTRIASPGGRRPETREVFSGRTLLDLKTPKGVYASHHFQLSAYEGARVEDGMPATKQQLVVRVGDDGQYEAVKNTSTYEDFLAILATYHAVKRVEAS